jgi:predicted secreted Zn-dependent protease
MMLGNMPGTEKWELTDSCQYLSRNARCDRNDQEILVDVVIVLGDGLC